jgi:hypothetical protein
MFLSFLYFFYFVIYRWTVVVPSLVTDLYVWTVTEEHKKREPVSSELIIFRRSHAARKSTYLSFASKTSVLWYSQAIPLLVAK